MINLVELTAEQLEVLARSRFGHLRARDVPSDWEEMVERDRRREAARVCFICGRRGHCRHREKELRA